MTNQVTFPDGSVAETREEARLMYMTHLGKTREFRHVFREWKDPEEMEGLVEACLNGTGWSKDPADYRVETRLVVTTSSPWQVPGE